MNVWNLKSDEQMDFDNSCMIPSPVALKVTHLRTLQFCTTLKPNGKFSGNFVRLDMGLTNSEKESNTMNVSAFIEIGSLLSGFYNDFIHLNISVFTTVAPLSGKLFICTQLCTVFK